MDQNGQNQTNEDQMDRMDRSGLHRPNWCELDQSGQKWTEVDRIEPNGPNRTEVD